MKKILSLILLCMLVPGLAACGKKKTETETAAVTLPAQAEAQTPAETAEAAEAAGMANPMVEITDSAQFGQGLGIDIDTDLLYAEAKMFITDGRVAECRFSFDSIMGENVDCVLRATKDGELADSLPGVYDSTLKEANSIGYTYPQGAFTVTVSENDAQDTLIYTWKIDDTWFSMVIRGKPSQMEVAEVMDSVMFATGIETASFVTGEYSEELEENWYALSEDQKILTVRLAGNATTGYEWSCKIGDESSLELIEENYATDAHAEGLVGVGGIWTASFRATGPDRRDTFDTYCGNDIRFTYSREWEGGSMPSKVIDLNIVGETLEITGVHEPDFSAHAAADDGEYDATLSFTDMIEQDEKNVYALIGVNSDANGENREYRSVYFTDQTELDDGMGAVYKDAAVGNIYNRMSHYVFADVKVTVEAGFVKKIKLYYHE